MDAIQFDQLPDLCLRKLFTFLSLRDLVKCRTVNRQFKYYADRTQVTELVVYGERGPQMCYQTFKKWFLTDRSIEFESAISMDTLKFAKWSQRFKLNQHLKFLHISVVSDSRSTFKVLNSLKQLIHLEMRSEIGSSEQTRSLALPNLRVLAIECRHSVNLKTPKLEALRCGMDRIELEYPETIKHLECLNVDMNCDPEDLAELSSLEVLHVRLYDNRALNNIRLSNLAALKELHITCCLQNCNGNVYEELPSLVLSLMYEKNALKRDELKLYLNNVLMVDDNQLLKFDPTLLDRFGPEAQVEDCFKFMNYRLLCCDSYPEITSVHFNQLMRLHFEISEDFFDRFPRIRSLTATDLVDQEQLEWFLQNATALSELNLTDTRIDQAFIDRLPNRLTRLEFYESSELVTNFQFLLQFEQLEVFETNRPLHPFDLASTAFRRLAKLKSLQFRTGSEFVKITRPVALKDNYSLVFFRMVRNHQETTQGANSMFDKKNLSWCQLETFYEQRRRSLIDEPEKNMKIKRARLE